MYFSKLFIHPCNFPQFSGSANMCRNIEMKWKYYNKHWLTVTPLQMSNLKWYHRQWCTQCHTHSRLDIWRMQKMYHSFSGWWCQQSWWQTLGDRAQVLASRKGFTDISAPLLTSTRGRLSTSGGCRWPILCCVSLGDEQWRWSRLIGCFSGKGRFF